MTSRHKKTWRWHQQFSAGGKLSHIKLQGLAVQIHDINPHVRITAWHRCSCVHPMLQMAILVKACLGQNCVRKGAQLSITHKETQSGHITTPYLPLQLTIIKECSKTLSLIRHSQLRWLRIPPTKAQPCKNPNHRILGYVLMSRQQVPLSSLVVRCRKHQTFNDGAGGTLEISKEGSGARKE